MASHETSKTTYVVVGGLNYAYRRLGTSNGTGTPFLLLHHFRATMDFWDPPFVTPLAQHRESILYDNAGVGQSTGQIPDSVSGMADHVYEFVRALKIKTVDIFGFSLGDMIAQQLALDHPELIHKLHAVGHICGLARTTPDTFIFMGSDCSHYAGMIRPAQYVPMPETIPADQLDPHYPPACLCSAFTAIHPHVASEGCGDHTQASSEARSRPFYDISRNPNGAYEFGDLAQDSVDKVKILDAQENVFVCLAHDGALGEVLPLYNKNGNAVINGWKIRGYKDKTRWTFLNELPRDGVPGRPPLTLGLWRNGNRVVWHSEEGWVEVSSWSEDD